MKRNIKDRLVIKMAGMKAMLYTDSVVVFMAAAVISLFTSHEEILFTGWLLFFIVPQLFGRAVDKKGVFFVPIRTPWARTHLLAQNEFLKNKFENYEEAQLYLLNLFKNLDGMVLKPGKYVAITHSSIARTIKNNPNVRGFSMSYLGKKDLTPIAQKLLTRKAPELNLGMKKFYKVEFVIMPETTL